MIRRIYTPIHIVSSCRPSPTVAIRAIGNTHTGDEGQHLRVELQKSAGAGFNVRKAGHGSGNSNLRWKVDDRMALSRLLYFWHNFLSEFLEVYKKRWASAVEREGEQHQGQLNVTRKVTIAYSICCTTRIKYIVKHKTRENGIKDLFV